MVYMLFCIQYLVRCDKGQLDFKGNERLIMIKYISHKLEWLQRAGTNQLQFFSRQGLFIYLQEEEGQFLAEACSFL